MRTLTSVAAGRAACRELAARGSLGLVPTMGALHEGHLSLVRAARDGCDGVVATIFVNPLQFGAGEDFEAYPRDAERDAALLAGAGADLALLLEPPDMYPPGFCTNVVQSALGDAFEGAERPGHFTGVLTVVAKLLLLAGATRAYFGRKDYQQTVVVRRMVADLAIPTDIVVCDTVRDADGLARSSRNAYLDADQRRRGLSLSAGLAAVQARFAAGERSVAALEACLADAVERGVGRAPDYAAIVDPDDLSTPPAARPGDMALVAARVGPARLLDNHVLGANIGPFPTGSSKP